MAKILSIPQYLLTYDTVIYQINYQGYSFDIEYLEKIDLDGYIKNGQLLQPEGYKFDFAFGAIVPIYSDVVVLDVDCKITSSRLQELAVELFNKYIRIIERIDINGSSRGKYHIFIKLERKLNTDFIFYNKIITSQVCRGFSRWRELYGNSVIRISKKFTRGGAIDPPQRLLEICKDGGNLTILKKTSSYRQQETIFRSRFINLRETI